ncbi:alpha/beta hydrolase [Saccharopolyspora sp. WRP15-2]|uniref:Alpha/beta hydrolase n=1 Tax=Saccharopolyspora oryzae TaxID=2997343 RepID=A0ABT4V2Q8_9PSEU|nr:alpha/beta hydrolase [Saccharopolyspora oryzae]MDA3628251.1 alpha/beta hydrolase [Saccharopolyspora oryzae]
MLGTTSPVPAEVTLELPPPAGPHRLGTTVLHLVDRDRTDPWHGGARELMVTVFYPADDVRGYPLAPQLTPAAAEAFKGFDPVYLHPELPDEAVDWAATATHSHTGAPAQPVRRPVLLYSPGGVDPRAIGTGLAEELASNGNVVVTIDHPGETSEVEFPGGRVRMIDMPGDPRTDPALFRTMLGTRIADTRFVLDQLGELAAGRNPDAESRELPDNLGRALDLRRVGSYGHSAGGATAAEVMHEDRRIAAAVNMEGYLEYLPEEPGELLPIAREGTDRPLLLLGTDGFRDERIERSWSAMLAHQRGCTRWQQLDDATHWVLTDYGTTAPQLQDAGLMRAEDRAKLVGTIDPAESVPAIRDHVVGFFATHLSR